MSLQIFMKIDNVPGESKNYDYPGWSEVLSLNWGMTSNRRTVLPGTDDRTSMNEISVVKRLGADSAAIRSLFAAGSTIPTVELSITPVVGQREAKAKYLAVSMTDVVIKSIVTGGGIEDSFFKEHVTLLFEKVRFEYNRNSPATRTAEGTSEDFCFGWDVAVNAAWNQ